MNINLKEIIRQGGTQQVSAEIKARLPAHISGPCQLTCAIEVMGCDDHYLLKLNVKGELTIICQRCLESFSMHYYHETQIAVCSEPEGAERLQEQFESIVAEHHEVNLIDILTDDLYLFTLEKHTDFEQCDDEINQFLQDVR